MSYFLLHKTNKYCDRDLVQPSKQRPDLHSKSVEIGADDGADDEDRQLEDAEDEAVFGGNTPLLLRLLRIERCLTKKYRR